MTRKHLSVGLEINGGVEDIVKCIKKALADGAHFAIMPLVHPRLRRHYGPGGVPTRKTFVRSDMFTTDTEWGDKIVAKVSPYIQLESPCPVLRQKYEDCFMEELSHFRGIGISSMLSLKRPDNNNLARLINNFCLQHPSVNMFWIEVPLENPALSDTILALKSEKEREEMKIADERRGGTWRWWSDFHRLINWNKRIGVALKLSADLPDGHILERWLGEPVRCVIIPTDVFTTNKKGYPILTKPHQKFVRDLMELDVQIVITGMPLHEEMSYYFGYVQNLWSTRPMYGDPMSCFSKGWEDYLQMPLQPLSDNLDSHTYSVFEKDPVKYDMYQKAVVAALTDRYCSKRNSESESTVNGKSPTLTKEMSVDKPKAIVMVLGAGRGPLVRAVINAGILTNVDLKVYAVEKNPTALATLHAQQQEIWGDQVTVIGSDMRAFKSEDLADIVVSELLGSFGDNELSPECLDGARHLLKSDGISIPCSYTSYINPIMSAKLWGLVSASEKSEMSPLPYGYQFETLWVVYQQNKYDIAQPQPLFTFNHPCPESDGGVERRMWATRSFKSSQSCTMHGFSGYFHCTLYGEHTLSILPENITDGMISWFPVFCPIKSPISLAPDDIITVNFWRCCNARKVWYEWNVTSPEVQPIQNPGGRSSEMIL